VGKSFVASRWVKKPGQQIGERVTKERTRSATGKRKLVQKSAMSRKDVRGKRRKNGGTEGLIIN